MLLSDSDEDEIDDRLFPVSKPVVRQLQSAAHVPLADQAQQLDSTNTKQPVERDPPQHTANEAPDRAAQWPLLPFVSEGQRDEPGTGASSPEGSDDHTAALDRARSKQQRSRVRPLLDPPSREASPQDLRGSLRPPLARAPSYAPKPSPRDHDLRDSLKASRGHRQQSDSITPRHRRNGAGP